MTGISRVGILPWQRACFRSPEGEFSGGGRGLPPVSRFNKLTLDGLVQRTGGLRNKVVLVRVDFNVTDPETGKIKSDARIRAALATINFLRQAGARIVLISHNERPAELVKKLVAQGKDQRHALTIAHNRLSLRPAADLLAKLLGGSVIFLTSPDPWDPINSDISILVESLAEGDVAVLENTRFYVGEESKDPASRLAFARQIAGATGAEHFIMDGFSVAHRDQASVTGVAQVIRERGGLVAAGRLMEQEIRFLGRALLENPARPYAAFMGGSKVADKIGVIETLLEKVDRLAIGGAMLYPFLLAMGKKAGADPLPPEMRSPEALEKEIALAKALSKKGGRTLVIPQVVVAQGPSGEIITVNLGLPGSEVPPDFKVRDVAPDHLESEILTRVVSERGNPQRVVWNGPFGKSEEDPFSPGTTRLLKIFSGFKNRAQGMVLVAGGGDTEKAIRVAKKAGIEAPFDHISTAGGAMLKLIEKDGRLPGIEAMDNG